LPHIRGAFVNLERNTWIDIQLVNAKNQLGRQICIDALDLCLHRNGIRATTVAARHQEIFSGTDKSGAQMPQVNNMAVWVSHEWF